MTALMIKDLSARTELNSQAMAEVGGGASPANLNFFPTQTNVPGVLDVVRIPTPGGPVPIPYPNFPTSRGNSKYNRKKLM